jgi:hypothetical protein
MRRASQPFLPRLILRLRLLHVALRAIADLAHALTMPVKPGMAPVEKAAR